MLFALAGSKEMFVVTDEWYLIPFPGNNNNNLLNQYEPAIGHHTYKQ